jgi:hypothetical protein
MRGPESTRTAFCTDLVLEAVLVVHGKIPVPAAIFTEVGFPHFPGTLFRFILGKILGQGLPDKFGFGPVLGPGSRVEFFFHVVRQSDGGHRGSSSYTSYNTECNTFPGNIQGGRRIFSLKAVPKLQFWNSLLEFGGKTARASAKPSGSCKKLSIFLEKRAILSPLFPGYQA